GVDRRVLGRDEVLKVEPALATFGHRIFGGTFTPSDESGDAKVYTQKLARLCAERGAQLLYEHDILGLQRAGDGIEAVQIAHTRSGERKT
ncbi:FAD-dependent oxidoreductase, partial [Klebsiella pneumoniae]|uniref:FAD-dependent oxidoreductase n=1 Tax=Klebsiella pneumoniae TaxID=573 RepID=UPI0039C3A06A